MEFILLGLVLNLYAAIAVVFFAILSVIIFDEAQIDIIKGFDTDNGNGTIDLLKFLLIPFYGFCGTYSIVVDMVRTNGTLFERLVSSIKKREQISNL